MKFNKVDYGLRVAEYRNKMNYSRKELMEKVSELIQDETVNNRFIIHSIETGKAPRLDLALPISQILEVNTLELIYGEYDAWLKELLIQSSLKQDSNYDKIADLIKWAKETNPKDIEPLLEKAVQLEPAYFISPKIKVLSKNNENQGISHSVALLTTQLSNWAISTEEKEDWINLITSLLTENQGNRQVLNALMLVVKLSHPEHLAKEESYDNTYLQLLSYLKGIYNKNRIE